MSRTPDIIFEYLRCIATNHIQSAKMDLKELDPDFQKVGQALILFRQMLLERGERYESEIYRGNFDSEPPSLQNIMAGFLEEIQGSLSYFDCQASPIDDDYREMTEEESKNTADILYHFVLDMIYQPKKAKLNIDDLEPRYHTVGQGLLLIDKMLIDREKFEIELCEKYNLDTSCAPPIENTISGPLKGLQSDLRYLARNTTLVSKSIVEGKDFTKIDSALGELGENFNRMIEQLKVDRTIIERKNQDVLTLLERTDRMLFICRRDWDHIYTRNHAVTAYQEEDPEHHPAYCRRLEEKLIRLTNERDENDSHTEHTTIDVDDGEGGTVYYEVENIIVPWDGERSIVYMAKDITDNVKEQDRMKEYAYEDQLTQTHNRRYAWNQMEERYNDKESFMVIFVDLDNLKYFNDKLGHDIGDQFLIRVAQVLKTVGDVVCRVGGDEFIVLANGSDVDTMKNTLERLRTDLRKEPVTGEFPQSFSYSVIGIPDKAEHPLDDYVRQADIEMYAYKKNNKGTNYR